MTFELFVCSICGIHFPVLSLFHKPINTQAMKSIDKAPHQSKYQALILLLIIVFISSIQIAFGQAITGTITDKSNGEPILFANVVVMGDSNAVLTGTTSDLDGFFNIHQLEPGKYDLKITFIGYKTLEVKDVQVPLSSPLEVELEFYVAEIIHYCFNYERPWYKRLIPRIRIRMPWKRTICGLGLAFEEDLKKEQEQLPEEETVLDGGELDVVEVISYGEIPLVSKDRTMRISQKELDKIAPLMVVELGMVEIIGEIPPLISLDTRTFCIISCCFGIPIIRDSVEISRVPPEEIEDEPDTRLYFYPNPTSGLITAEMEGDISELFLTDLSGRLLQKIDVRDKGKIQLDLSAYPKGMYFLEYHDGKEIVSGKVVLAK